MCGIAGIISFDKDKVSQPRLQLMTDSISHRGPEGEGLWMNENSVVGFGHRRLSIIDLSNAGAQPMHYLNRYTIVYNGEIYNYIELKSDLEKKGFQFSSHCDTEAILAAFACYGNECLQLFDGMFAFAIWDEVEQKLFCARDRFGEKPFYFFYEGTQFLFASEMKALWSADVEKSINDKMLLNYLTIGYTSNPAEPVSTFYNGIFKLPAANCLELIVDKSSEKITYSYWQYWDLNKQKVSAEPKKYLIETFTDLLQTSVNRRLRSDVPIGSSLSGGLDSSTIVAFIHRLIGDSSKQKTFSAVFPGYEKDESAFIKQVVDAFQVNNFTTTPTAAGFIEDFEKLVYHQEEPFQSTSIYAQYKVYELAKNHGVTVILDGQGADEILAGYNKYYHWYWQELIGKGKWKLAQLEWQSAKANNIQESLNWKNYLSAYMPGLTAKQLQKKALQQQKNHPALTHDFLQLNTDKSSLEKPVIEKLNDILYYNTMQFGLEELLRYADRNAMAHSREVRLPFLNHELVQFIFNLPSSHKINKGISKYLLRLAMESSLPSAIVWRKDKIGYEPPQKLWMQQPEIIERIMHSRKKLVEKGVLKKNVLEQPVESLSAHEANNYDWRYLCAVGSLFS